VLFCKLFGSKKDEVTGDWRRLHSEELYDVYSLPNIIRAIKLRRMCHIWGEGRCREGFDGETCGKV
jgi:hypothetical protein